MTLANRGGARTVNTIEPKKYLVISLKTVIIGVSLFLALFPIATFLVGYGLAARFSSMDIYKIASYVLVIGGAVGFVNFIVALNSPDLGLDLLLYVNSTILWVGGICLFIIGLGMYKERSELTADVA